MQTDTPARRNAVVLGVLAVILVLVSFPLVGIATLAIGFGAEAPMVMTLLLGALAITGASSFAVFNQRS